MSKKKIAKPQVSATSNIPKPTFLTSLGDDKIVFSFASLEWTEYFSFDGTCSNW